MACWQRTCIACSSCPDHMNLPYQTVNQSLSSVVEGSTILSVGKDHLLLHNQESCSQGRQCSARWITSINGSYTYLVPSLYSTFFSSSILPAVILLSILKHKETESQAPASILQNTALLCPITRMLSWHQYVHWNWVRVPLQAVKKRGYVRDGSDPHCCGQRKVLHFSWRVTLRLGSDTVQESQNCLLIPK